MLITFMGLNMDGLGLPGSLTKSQPTDATTTALNAFLQVPEKSLDLQLPVLSFFEMSYVS